MSVMVLGTVALDHVQTPSGIKKDMLGGSAAHFAMAARLFTDVHMVAVVGTDFPKRHINFLKRKGIDLSSLHINQGKTFRWTGRYNEGDLNTALTLATDLGVLASYTPHVTDHQKRLPNIFLANFDPDLQMELLSHLKAPRFIGLDSMNLWINTKPRRLKRLMKMVHLFVANDTEARSLSGEHNLIKAAKGLVAMGPRMVVIKKGEHGVLFYGSTSLTTRGSAARDGRQRNRLPLMFSFPAYPVEKVVDPTGAGDTFAGGLMGYLSNQGRIGDSALRKALLYATSVASFNVQGFGMARTAALSMADVEARKKKFVQFFAAG